MQEQATNSIPVDDRVHHPPQRARPVTPPGQHATGGTSVTWGQLAAVLSIVATIVLATWVLQGELGALSERIGRIEVQLGIQAKDGAE